MAIPRKVIRIGVVTGSNAFHDSVSAAAGEAVDMTAFRFRVEPDTSAADGRPDLAVVHLDGLPKGSARIWKHIPVLFVSRSFETVLEAGPPESRPWGWIPADSSPGDFRAAVRMIRRGFVCVHGSAAGADGAGFPIFDRPVGRKLIIPDKKDTGIIDGEYVRLSSREREILELLPSGYSNVDIGRILRISENTVKFHLGEIYSRLGVSGRTEAVREGIRLGLLSV